jgi:hypothetical protein
MIGDIIFARFPLADREAFKERPCLVLSRADERGDVAGRVALGVGFDVRDISPPPKALSEPDKRLSHIRLLTLHRSGAFVAMSFSLGRFDGPV